MNNEESSRIIILITEVLRKLGLGQSNDIAIVDENKIESTEEFLQKRGVRQDAIIAREIEAEGKHRRTSRTIVLLTVIPLSAVLVIWCMVLITLSGLGKTKFTNNFMWGILGASTLDFLGLCYVIASDLFPQGKPFNSHRENVNEKE